MHRGAAAVLGVFSALHPVVTPWVYGEWSADAVWFVGTGLGLLLLAGMNVAHVGLAPCDLPTAPAVRVANWVFVAFGFGVRPDARAWKDDLLRIIDETGEDYLFGTSLFSSIFPFRFVARSSSFSGPANRCCCWQPYLQGGGPPVPRRLCLIACSRTLSVGLRTGPSSSDILSRPPGAQTKLSTA